MSTSTELADLFLTLRTVNAPMLRGFEETTVAGEQMTAGLQAQLAEFDAMIARTGEALASLRVEMGAVAGTAVTPHAPIAASEAGTAGNAEAIAAEQELGAAANEAAAEYTASRTQMRDAQGRFVAADKTGTDEILAGYQRLIAQAQASAAEVSASMAEMRSATETASAGMAAAENEATAANQRLATTMDDSGVVAKAAVAKWGTVAGAALIAVGAFVHSAADYDTTSKRLVTSAGESASQLGYVQQGMLDLAGQLGVSAQQLAKDMYPVGSAGYHAAEGLGVLKAAEQGAKAEGADAATVADALSSAMRDYYPAAKGAQQVTADATDVMSKFIGATSAGKMTFQDLASSLHSVLPAASAAKIPLNDILGALAAMTVHGMSADQATQNLAHAIGHLQTVTAPQAKELGLLHISARQLSDDLSTKGLTGTVQEIGAAIEQHMGPGTTHVILSLTDAMSKLPTQVQGLAQAAVDGTISWTDYSKAAGALPPELQGQAMGFASLAKSTHALGQDQKTGADILQSYSQSVKAAMGDQTGLNVALMLTGQNADYTNSAVKQISASTADAQGNVKGWAEIQGTFNQRLADAKAGLGALVIEIGQRLLPVATSIASAIAHVTTSFASNKTLATALAVVIGSVLVVSLAALVTKLLQVGRGATTAVGQLSLFAGALTFGLSHMNSFAGVATLVVTGLVAISVAANALKAPWTQMTGYFAKAQTELVGWIGKIGAAEGAMATFKVVGSGVLSFLTGPWGVALGAAVAAFGLFSSSSKDATQQETDFTSAIQQDSGALGDNTRAQAENTLEKDDAGKAASQLGINMGTLTDAVLGNKSALDQVNQRMATFFKNADDAKQGMISSSEQTRTNAASYLLLANAIPQVTKSVNDSIDAYHRQQQAGVAASNATTQAGNAASTAASQTTDLTTVQGKLAIAMSVTQSATNNVAATVGGSASTVSDALNSMSSAAQAVNDQMSLLNGNNISAEQSLITVRDDVDKVTKAFHDNGSSINDNTTAGRANITAILDAATAAQKHAEAVTQQTGLVEKGNAAFQQDVDALQAVMKSAGLTAQQIQDLTSMYLQVPHDLTTNFNTPGLDSAIAGTAALAQNMGNVPHGKGGVRGFSTGGYVGYPIGGAVSGPGSDTSDSIAAMLSNNEYVVNAASARKATYPVLDALNSGNLRQAYSLLGSAMGGDGAYASPSFGGLAVGGGGSAAPVVNVTINAGAVADEIRLQKLLQKAVLQYTNRNSSAGWTPAFR